MKIVNHREFDKEYFEAKKKLYGTDIELIQDGDGIDAPMKVKIAIPGVMMDFEEAAVFAEKLSKAATKPQISQKNLSTTDIFWIGMTDVC